LMEGRYRALTSHWKEQGEVVDRTVRKLGGEMTALVQERLRDGERLDALQQLCNEQRENLARLQEENKTIAETSKAHRDEQDASLAGIRAKAHAQEKANEDTLAETKAALHKLKWALGVNKNVGTD
jgi:vacuolar-type H+-ATPase subunit I/STV1